MHYDDRSRRLNLATGLVFGAALGAGLALLLAPPRKARAARRRAGRAARALRRAAGNTLEDTRDRADDVRQMARRRFSL